MYLSISFLQQLLSTFPHDDQVMSASSYGNRQKYGAKNTSAPEVSIESLVSEILQQDVYQHVIAQAAAYMKSFKESKG